MQISVQDHFTSETSAAFPLLMTIQRRLYISMDVISTDILIPVRVSTSTVTSDPYSFQVLTVQHKQKNRLKDLLCAQIHQQLSAQPTPPAQFISNTFRHVNFSVVWTYFPLTFISTKKLWFHQSKKLQLCVRLKLWLHSFTYLFNHNLSGFNILVSST